MNVLSAAASDLSPVVGWLLGQAPTIATILAIAMLLLLRPKVLEQLRQWKADRVASAASRRWLRWTNRAARRKGKRRTRALANARLYAGRLPPPTAGGSDP